MILKLSISIEIEINFPPKKQKILYRKKILYYTVYRYCDNVIIVNYFHHDIIYWTCDTMTALQRINQNDMEEGQAFSVYWVSATMLMS